MVSICTTRLSGWGSPQELNLKMDGQTREVNYTGLTDIVSRVIPDGFELFVNQPYSGNLFYSDGSTSGVWLTIPVKNGGLEFLYRAPYAPRKCWPLLDTQDTVTFDDSWTRENWYGIVLIAKYAKAPEGCIE